MEKPKVGDRVKWIGQAEVSVDYGTVTHVLGKRFEVRWDTPDPDSGEDTFSYSADRPESSIRPA